MKYTRAFAQKVETIAKQAGQTLLLPAFISQSASQSIKADGSIVTETDQLCQDYIQRALALLSPSYGFLGEEMPEEEQLACLNQQDGTPFWCVDPLDGTGNFATPMPLFGVSIALIDKGQPVLACIYDPVRDEMFTAIKGQGLLVNGELYPASTSHKQLIDTIGFVDFKRLSSGLAHTLVTEKRYRSQRNLGTCALEWAWLAAGRAQFVLHGGQKLWDYAAGLLLAEEAGCVVTDFAGKPPFAAPRLSCPIVATASPSLQKSWLEIVEAKKI
ncbi:MAG: inositol monophosphatase family protein [Ghiorsea sp.]